VFTFENTARINRNLNPWWAREAELKFDLCSPAEILVFSRFKAQKIVINATTKLR
jgi:hypothetical protein